MVPRRDARQLTQSAQEELRYRAVSMVRSGLTQALVAQMLEVSRGAVNMWCRRADEHGDEALRKRRRGQPVGRRQILTGTQAATVCNIIRDRCPEQVKLPFALWTREAVQRLIYVRFGIDLAVRTVGDYLARWGFTVQKPAVRVYECSAEAVRRWVEEEYPRIAARAKAEGARVWWGDETGLRSRHYTGTSFSPRGKTPITRGSGKHFGCNLFSAITNKGELAFLVYEGKFNAAIFQDGMERLVRHADGKKVFLILDNLRVHHAKVLKPWLEEHRDEIELFFIPSYSPHLNPDELLNHDLKANAVGRKRARNKDELIANATSHLEGRARTPDVVAAFFREAHVRYAA
jgi:transposase